MKPAAIKTNGIGKMTADHLNLKTPVDLNSVQAWYQEEMKKGRPNVGISK